MEGLSYSPSPSPTPLPKRGYPPYACPRIPAYSRVLSIQKTPGGGPSLSQNPFPPSFHTPHTHTLSLSPDSEKHACSPAGTVGTWLSRYIEERRRVGTCCTYWGEADPPPLTPPSRKIDKSDTQTGPQTLPADLAENPVWVGNEQRARDLKTIGCRPCSSSSQLLSLLLLLVHLSRRDDQIGLPPGAPSKSAVLS